MDQHAVSADGQVKHLARHRTTRERSQITNLAWVVFDRSWRLVLSFIVTLLAARVYGPHGFGVLSFGLALTALVQPIATFGIDQIVVRDLVDDDLPAPLLIGTAAFTRLLGAISAFAAALTVTEFVGPDAHDQLAIVAVLLVPVFFQVFDPIEFFYQSRRRADIAARARVVGSLIAMGIRVVLIVHHVSVLTFAASYILDAAIPSLIIFGTFGMRATAALRCSLAVMRRQLRDGWPLVLSALFVVVYQRIDQVMIASISGPAEAGIYAAATRLSELYNFLPASALAVLGPILMRARTDPDRLARNRRSMFGVLGSVALVISLVNVLIAGFAIRFLFGPEFVKGVLMLQVQAASTIFVFLGTVQAIANVAEGKQALGMRAVGIGAAVNIGLNLVLIPRFGGTGAAAATLVAYSLASTFAYWMFTGQRHVPTEQGRALALALRNPARTLRSFTRMIRQS